MRLLAHMVTRNEAGRYLNDCLTWLRPIVDGIAVFDDQSDDSTPWLAEQHGARVGVRGEGVPAFRAHEGEFREAGWRFMESALEPELGDWILCLDADEFPVAAGSEREVIERQIGWADDIASDGFAVEIPEVFHVEAGQLYIRTDGYWGETRGVRLVRWKPAGVFRPVRHACGSVPTYVRGVVHASDVALLHLGYADARDRKERHLRYSGTSGHNPHHVSSILRQPCLQRWEGKQPPVS